MALVTKIDRTAFWMTAGDSDSNCVISSRVRLARNLRGKAFPPHADESQLIAVLSEVFDFVGRAAAFRSYHSVRFEELTELERQSLVERYLTSREHIEHVSAGGLIFDSSGSVSLLVNEEDHFRIQTLSPGLRLQEALKAANEMDDLLDGSFGYSFSADYGYLTSCPTNVGTGLRASVMMHLPGLVLLNRIGKVVEAARQVGLAVRGVYGEGSDADGNLFQVSNQITLGRSEAQILSEIESVTREIIKHEQTARAELLHTQRIMVEDHVWRAYGILIHARSISTSEATNRLSALRLGTDLGMLEGISDQRFNELLIWMRPACLQTFQGKSLEAGQRDQLRATLLRNALSAVTAARS